MIPEEVAAIATLLRNNYYDYPYTNDEFRLAVEVAWKIYNLMKEENK